jgi:hypothetical protein
MAPSPKIDSRTAADVAEQTRALLCRYLAGPPYRWPADADGGEAGRALTAVFGRFCGLIIERLNRAPEKNFLAFLDLLGNAPIAAQPARAVVTLSLDPTTPRGLLLKAGARVQAEPPPGARDPVFFETDRDVWLTTVDLVAIRKGATSLNQLIRSSDVATAPVFDDGNPLDFGFSIALDRPVPAQLPVEIYFWFDAASYDPVNWGSQSGAAPAPLTWEYSTTGGNPWKRLLVEDETGALTRAGVLRFLSPIAEEWARVKDTAPTFWVRANPPANVPAPAPRLRAVALNSVPATQAWTVSNEMLGSSNGVAGQQFRTLKQPVLPGQQLDVLERAATITIGELAAPPPVDAWIAWHEVNDFHASGAADRHYVVNRQTGQIRFGDGQRGMIPPRGTRNIRMTAYRAGGGAAGNIPGGALKTLVSGSKQIAKVTNLFAAGGGADAETNTALMDRAPRLLRHRHRAVTQEDYEDLSQLASTEVARALCVPLQDLAAEPYLFIDSDAEQKAGVGKVSVVIVPDTAQAKPLPSPDLMRAVQAFLSERASAGATVTVVGPLYLQVKVEVLIKLHSLQLRDVVERDVQARLAAFLHPLTGNGGTGWPFGRLPHESDLYPLLATINGVDFVADLTITPTADDAARTTDTLTTQRFLIYSGVHTVSFV